MSKQYSNEMRLAIFANDKRTKDSQPTHRGQFEMAGVKYKVSLWLKNGCMSGPIELDTYKPSGEPSRQVTADDARAGFAEVAASVKQDDSGVPF